MQLVQPEDAAAQIVIAEERLKILAHRGDEAVVNRHRDVVAKERRLQRGRMIARPRAEDIRL